MDLSGIFGSTQNFVLIATAIPVLIIVAIIAGVAVSRSRKAAVAASNWSMTTGQVLAAGAQPYRTRAGTGMTTMYRPVVSYVYTVNGRQYASDRLSLGMGVGYGSAGIVERMVSKYTPGSMVQVYYNPENPAEATLETRARGSGLLWVIVLILLAVLAVTVIMTLSMGSFMSGLIGNFFN